MNNTSCRHFLYTLVNHKYFLNINTKFPCFIYLLFSHINVCIILFEKPGVTQEEWTTLQHPMLVCEFWFQNFLGFPFADDVTGVGLITKNKVISSEGAGQGKCNEEIEKKLITITISLLLIRIFLVIMFSRMFCQQNIKVSGCFRCFAVPVFWFWSIHILFDSVKFEYEGEIFMYNDRV